MIIVSVWATVLLSFAVKQLSYALFSGSLFQPLRRSIEQKTVEGVWGFKTLNELFTCRLCMTMQVSLWFVALPALLFGMFTSPDSAAFGVVIGGDGGMVLRVLGILMYAIAVSGIALAFWIHLEYPAERYQETLLKLKQAEQTIMDLQELLATKRTRSRRSIATEMPEQIPVDEFRKFVQELDTSCSRIGCGFARRSCRIDTLSEWLDTWSRGDPMKRALIPKLRKTLEKLLPPYVSEHHGRRSRTDEAAFMSLYVSMISRIWE